MEERKLSYYPDGRLHMDNCVIKGTNKLTGTSYEYHQNGRVKTITNIIENGNKCSHFECQLYNENGFFIKHFITKFDKFFDLYYN